MGWSIKNSEFKDYKFDDEVTLFKINVELNQQMFRNRLGMFKDTLNYKIRRHARKS